MITRKGQITIIAIILIALGAGLYIYKSNHREKAKMVDIKTKATNLPSFKYDKNANAEFRPVPKFGEFASVDAPVVNGSVMEWYAQLGLCLAVGGKQTTVGSLAEEFKLNIHLNIQNDCGKQGDDLYTFAEELHNGVSQPTKGAAFIAWMGDAVPNYFSGLNERLKKDFGEEYMAKVYTFGGSSDGEDKWLLTERYTKNAIGSLTCTVIRDGDWNICIMKSQLMGWPVNYNTGTYDPTKVNFIAAPENNYLKATELFVSGQKQKLKLIKNGVITNQDTLVSISGVSTWFPGDWNAVTKRPGLVSVASTKDFSSQMPNAIIFISKWANENREFMENFCAIVGLAGDQIKSHPESLEYAAKAAQDIFASTMTEEDIVKAYNSFDYTDDIGKVVNVGGSRVFNLADACNYIGINGGGDKYKTVYNTFGNICVEAYPELLSSFPDYENATDYTFLKAAYNKYKSKAGNVTKTDFKEATKSNSVLGDNSYNIEFNTGSSVIKPTSYAVLDKILAQLDISDRSFIDLAGHTDNTGSNEINIPLSKQRAEAVRQYLIERNESLSDRIQQVVGYGSTKPISDNTTEVGKSKNRRVEIKLLRTN